MAKRPRVLVVQDEPGAFVTTAGAMESAGFDVDVVTTEDECLQAARQSRHEFVVLSDTDSKWDALELCKRLKTDPTTRDSQVILLSAGKEPSGPLEPEHRPDVRVAKPISDGDLLATVRSMVHLRRMENALREGDSILKTFLDELPIGAAVVSLDQRFLRANAAFCDITGYARGELTALRCSDMIHADDLEANAAGFRQLASGELELYNADQRYIRKNGDTAWIRARIRPLRNTVGESLHMLLLIEDITERKQVGMALRESEEKYRQLVDNLNEGIWAIDKDAYTTFVNDRMAEMLGYTPAEMEGKHLFSFMDDRGKEICQRNLERRKQGIHEDHEFELLRKDGTRVYTIMQTSPLTDKEGNYTGALAGVLDITRRKQAEEKLQKAHTDLEQRDEERASEIAQANVELREEIDERIRAEQLFRQLLESAPDAMVVANQDGEIVLVNAVTEMLFGYTREELVGQPVEIIVPRRFHDKHREHRARYGKSPHLRPMGGTAVELFGVRKDGSEFPAEVSLGPLKTEEGLLVFSAIRDVTERKRAEEALRENDAQLRAARRIQEHLLPAEAPELSGFDIAGASYPAAVAGGDHYDYFLLPDGDLAIVIGDVSGHGFSSALLMATAHAQLRSLAEADHDIAEVFTRVNSSLIKQREAGYFVTAVLARIDPRSRELTFVNAGHPTGFVVDKSGEVKARLESMSLPLAVDPGSEYRVGETIRLESGDVVLLLTDGILEAVSPEGEFFGVERALEVVRDHREEPAGKIIENLCRATRGFLGDEKQQDDVTVVVIKAEFD